MRKTLGDTSIGLVIATLVWLLIGATIGLFYEAQVIARQQAVIHMLEERR